MVRAFDPVVNLARRTCLGVDARAVRVPLENAQDCFEAIGCQPVWIWINNHRCSTVHRISSMVHLDTHREIEGLFGLHRYSSVPLCLSLAACEVAQRLLG